MADSVYISKNLDENQLRFMKLLEVHEILYFDMHHIEKQINDKFQNLNEILENLVDKELLVRVERGKYTLSNYNNINTLATFISQNSCIGYWSALHHHGLTERFPNKIFVKTIKRKRDTEVLGTAVKFITVNESKQIGMIKEGYGDDAFSITDLEMTMVDCFDQPRYAGDYSDLIKAFAQAELRNKRLIEYTRVYHNIALTKRLGYLSELFHSKTLKTFIEYANKQVNNRYNLIDSGGNEEGAFVSKWKIRLNVSEKDLLSMAQNEY